MEIDAVYAKYDSNVQQTYMRQDYTNCARNSIATNNIGIPPQGSDASAQPGYSLCCGVANHVRNEHLDDDTRLRIFLRIPFPNQGGRK